MKIQALEEVMSREMTRKEFLLQVGSALLVMVGVSSLIKGLHQFKAPTYNAGYGSSVYGGQKR